MSETPVATFTLCLTHGSEQIASSIRRNVPAEDIDTVREELQAIAAERAEKFGTRSDSYRIATRDGDSTATLPTADLLVAVTRFIALIEAGPHRRGGRHMVSKAVYGDLWTPDRVGDVPAEDRPALRALVSEIIRRVLPHGAYSSWVTADEVRALYGIQPAPPTGEPAN